MGLSSDMTGSLWPRADNHTLPLLRFAFKVSRYLNLLQRVQIRYGLNVLFVNVWTRIWYVIFHFSKSSSSPALLSLLYRRWRFVVIVVACKSDHVACHQSPSNVMPHLMAVSSLHSSSSTAGTWLFPRYAAYFQFHTDENEQNAILNIHSAMDISSFKKGSKQGKKMERRTHPKTTTVSQSMRCHMR